MRPDFDWRIRLIEWVGVAPLRRSREHVLDTWNGVGRLRLMLHAVFVPLYRNLVRAHGGSPTSVALPGIQFQRLVP